MLGPTFAKHMPIGVNGIAILFGCFIGTSIVIVLEDVFYEWRLSLKFKGNMRLSV